MNNKGENNHSLPYNLGLKGSKSGQKNSYKKEGTSGEGRPFTGRVVGEEDCCGREGGIGRNVLAAASSPETDEAQEDSPDA